MIKKIQLLAAVIIFFQACSKKNEPIVINNSTAQINEKGIYYIAVNTANIRSDASLGSNAVMQLKEGEVVDVTGDSGVKETIDGKEGTWLSVKTATEASGYLFSGLAVSESYLLSRPVARDGRVKDSSYEIISDTDSAVISFSSDSSVVYTLKKEGKEYSEKGFYNTFGKRVFAAFRVSAVNYAIVPDRIVFISDPVQKNLSSANLKDERGRTWKKTRR